MQRGVGMHAISVAQTRNQEIVGAAERRELAVHRGGEFGRCTEDPSLWALVTLWEGVGAYRRGLSASAVKIAGAPVWVHALDEPGAYVPDGNTDVAGRRRD